MGAVPEGKELSRGQVRVDVTPWCWSKGREFYLNHAMLGKKGKRVGIFVFIRNCSALFLCFFFCIFL